MTTPAKTSENSRIRRETALGYCFLFLGGVFWGTSGVFYKLLQDLGVASNTVAFFTLGVAALDMGIFVLITKGPGAFRIPFVSILRLGLTGFLAETMYHVVYIRAVKLIGVGYSSILMYSSPIFACIFAAIFFREKITWAKAAAIALNIAGCLLAVTGGAIEGTIPSVFGILLGVSSGLFYAMEAVLGKWNADLAHPYVVTFYVFLTAFIFMIPFAQPWKFDASLLGAPKILCFLGAGTLSAAIPCLLYMIGMTKPVEASRALVFASSEPVVAAVLGAVLFHEVFGIWSVLGIAIIIGSIFLMNRVKSEKAARSGET